MASNGFYHRGYNFKVLMNGSVFSFSKISGLERESQLEQHQEGGYNGYVHRLRGQDSGQHMLVLEYGTTNLNSMLENIEPGRYIPDGVCVEILGSGASSDGKKHLLEGCYLQKISFGDLDASSSTLFINRMEIVYSRLTLQG